MTAYMRTNPDCGDNTEAFAASRHLFLVKPRHDPPSERIAYSEPATMAALDPAKALEVDGGSASF